MEDLIPFLIFIAIAAINAVKFFAEKGGRKRPSGPTPASPPQRPRRTPSSLEDLFEEISRRMAPPPHDLPDWPEEVERPDYVREMAEFKAPKVPPVPVYEPQAVPDGMARMKAESVTLELQPAVKPVSFQGISSDALLSGLGSMRIAMPPILRSAAGTTRLELQDRDRLKRALLAKMVFGPPRAYDRSFDNTVM